MGPSAHPRPPLTQVVDTPRGPARLFIDRPARPTALVVLGHGAGGDHTATVLTRCRDVLLDAGCAVALFDQPYRVAGRRVPDPPHHLDAAHAAIVSAARAARVLARLPLVLGGKSSGARVACRSAAAAGALGVVCLGFPLHPPGRPERSRADELLSAPCPVLVCQGSRDSFGTPDDVAAVLPRKTRVTLHAIDGGDHSFSARRADGRTTGDCLDEVASTVVQWVTAQLAAT